MGFVAMTGFDIKIDADGSNAFVTLLQKIGVFRLKIPFRMMSRLKHRIDRVVDEMDIRQKALFDEGEDSIDLIKAHAPMIRRDGCEVTVEGGEVVVLYQFQTLQGPPLAVRMTIDDANALVAEFGNLKSSFLH